MDHPIQDHFYKDDWLISSANELGCLAQGLKRGIEGTDTIFFITKQQVPKGRIVTKITAGGNLITDYPGPMSTETAGLETLKIHWNSVLSTSGAKWMKIDISNMYLKTPLDCFENKPMHQRDVPQEIINEGLVPVKIHWNSVLSVQGAKWMGMDISNMYSNTPLDRFEYMRMH